MILNDLVKEIERIDPDDIQKLGKLVNENQQIIMLGNGGSNAVCSHISQDYTKQLKKKAFSFSDASRLTCYINDYGMDAAYLQFLKEFESSDNTLIVLISSSGNSENVYRCAKHCSDTQAPFVMLTGFDEENRMRKDFSKHASIDMWVDSHDYGIVECVHQIFLHAILGEMK